MLERENDLMSCTLAYAFYAIGGKWKPYIIWYLHLAENNTLRYGELKRSIPFNVSHKVFTQQLNQLEEDGIIRKIQYSDEVIPRTEYSLTEMGKFVAPAILYLRDWAALFGKRYQKNAIERTVGEWNNDLIHYGYTSAENPNLQVMIDFNVDINKNQQNE